MEKFDIFDELDDTVEYLYDDENNLVINFENLEKLSYFLSLEVLDRVNPDSAKESAFMLLNMFTYELLNCVFPKEMHEFCESHEYLLNKNTTKMYS